MAQLAKGCPAAGIIAEPMQVLATLSSTHLCQVLSICCAVMHCQEIIISQVLPRRRVVTSMALRVGSRECKIFARSTG